VARDVRDSAACAVPYQPEHNVNMAVFVGIMRGDYAAAAAAARRLLRAKQLFQEGYMTTGIDHAMLLQVQIFFGRCAPCSPVKAVSCVPVALRNHRNFQD
jgi:hypothetical protein